MSQNKQIPPTEQQLDDLDTMNDVAIDFSDIPEILDWGGAESGKFDRQIIKTVIWEQRVL